MKESSVQTPHRFYRYQIWRHNGFLGSITLLERTLEGARDYPTVSGESREQIEYILPLLHRLKESLRIKAPAPERKINASA